MEPRRNMAEETLKEALAEYTALCERHQATIAQLRLAVEAGLKAFEFLGERLNENDGAAGESMANLDKLSEWGDIMRACISGAREQELAEEVWAMLDKDSDSDGD